MLRTAESVSPKHPDKICDRISDAILDEALRQDPESRVAIEVMGGHGIVSITGEMTTKAYISIRDIAKRIAGNIGVQVNVVQQSPDIAQGVDQGGAGDQGIMVGYACDETPQKMPLEVMVARNLCDFIYSVYPYDGKTQVTLEDGEIKTVVASFQNTKQEDLKSLVEDWVRDDSVEIYCNPAGDWTTGGFDADTGVTGRKLMVDNYGPRVPIGGGAFSGKDPTKVDRSAAYAARNLAVRMLDKHRAKEVFVYLAYAIGRAMPVQATAIIDGVEMNIDPTTLTPVNIIETLNLRKPQYEKTAEWGHFGNNFTWDK